MCYNINNIIHTLGASVTADNQAFLQHLVDAVISLCVRC